jgi:hypothetical protein
MPLKSVFRLYFFILFLGVLSGRSAHAIVFKGNWVLPAAQPVHSQVYSFWRGFFSLVGAPSQNFLGSRQQTLQTRRTGTRRAGSLQNYLQRQTIPLAPTGPFQTRPFFSSRSVTIPVSGPLRRLPQTLNNEYIFEVDTRSDLISHLIHIYAIKNITNDVSVFINDRCILIRISGNIATWNDLPERISEENLYSLYRADFSNENRENTPLARWLRIFPENTAPRNNRSEPVRYLRVHTNQQEILSETDFFEALRNIVALGNTRVSQIINLEEPYLAGIYSFIIAFNPGATEEEEENRQRIITKLSETRGVKMGKSADTEYQLLTKTYSK